MKKLLFIVLALVAIWIGGRYVLHRGEVRATIVMHDAATLRSGDPVIESGVVVGRVTKIAHLDGDDAISIRVARDHSRAVVSDSLFAVDGRQLIVSNTFTLGAPIADGAVLRARDSGIAQWLARHGGTLAPVMAKAKNATDTKLDEVRASVAKMEDELRRSNHLDEAKALRAKFEKWVAEVRR
ncbi:MAG TPA: MlaD family protein [Thermoanaerobaculia bacterium]|nr:MlaD family protein [Thermoanaerobaculia bacterium]